MLISAIIPTYNYGRYVARAVESVLGQTYAPLECVVVDDGSTDDTPAALARFEGRIRVIRQPNRGLSAARNTGLAAARGEGVALLDADDAWKPGKIARQVSLLREDPSIAVVGCGTELVDGRGERIAIVPMPSPSPGAAALREIALRTRWVGGSGSGALIRRSVLDEVGTFDEALTAAEDWDMWLRIAAGHRIVNVPDVLVTICRHGRGPFRNSSRMESSQLRVYEAAVARWPDRLDGRTRRRMRALIAYDAGMELASAGEPAAALGRYLTSLRHWPLQGRGWFWAARAALRIVGV